MKETKEIQCAETLAALISKIIVYWDSNEKYYADRIFSSCLYSIELDYDTAENIVMNFSYAYYPCMSELTIFLECLYEKWKFNSKIKRAYPKFYDLVVDLTTATDYYEEYSKSVYDYDGLSYFQNDHVDDDILAIDEYSVEDIFVPETGLVGFDDDIQYATNATKIVYREGVDSQISPLEKMAATQLSEQQDKKLKSIFNSLIGPSENLYE